MQNNFTPARDYLKSDDGLRQLIKQLLTLEDDEDTIRSDLEEIIPKYFNGNTLEKEAAKEKLEDLRPYLASLISLDEHLMPIKLADKENRPLALKLARAIEDEIGAEGKVFKAMIDVAVSSYIRFFELSAVFKNVLELDKYKMLNRDRLQYYALVGKEIDRAERHFIGTLLSIRQMYSPKAELTIKAQTAFIAENQVINHTLLVTEQNGEINDVE